MLYNTSITYLKFYLSLFNVKVDQLDISIVLSVFIFIISKICHYWNYFSRTAYFVYSFLDVLETYSLIPTK